MNLNARLFDLVTAYTIASPDNRLILPSDISFDEVDLAAVEAPPIWEVQRWCLAKMAGYTESRVRDRRSIFNAATPTGISRLPAQLLVEILQHISRVRQSCTSAAHGMKSSCTLRNSG